MGADYYFYTEARVGDRWYSIDPRVLRVPQDGKGMKYVLNETFWSGSRSYFGETYTKLFNLSSPISFLDTSTEFRVEKLLIWDEWYGEDSATNAEEFYDSVLRVISYADLCAAMPKDGIYQYHGFVHKDYITQLEDGEIDDIDGEMMIPPEEYSKLIPEARRVYQYYEWNDPMSWRAKLPVVVQRVRDRIREFEDVNLCDYDDVRVIFYMS